MALRSTTMTLRAVLILAFGIAWVGGEAQAATSGQQLAESAGRSLIGKPAPRLVVTTIDGETIDLGRLYGKQAVYLKFWATWCVPCREQMPHFERTYETAGTDLAVIAVNTGFNDPIGDVRDYRRKMGTDDAHRRGRRPLCRRPASSRHAATHRDRTRWSNPVRGATLPMRVLMPPCARRAPRWALPVAVKMQWRRPLRVLPSPSRPSWRSDRNFPPDRQRRSTGVDFISRCP